MDSSKRPESMEPLLLTSVSEIDETADDPAKKSESQTAKSKKQFIVVKSGGEASSAYNNQESIEALSKLVDEMVDSSGKKEEDEEQPSMTKVYRASFKWDFNGEGAETGSLGSATIDKIEEVLRSGGAKLAETEDDLLFDELVNIGEKRGSRENEGQDTITTLSNQPFLRQLRKAGMQLNLKRKESIESKESSSSSRPPTSPTMSIMSSQASIQTNNNKPLDVTASSGSYTQPTSSRTSLTNISTAAPAASTTPTSTATSTALSGLKSFFKSNEAAVSKKSSRLSHDIFKMLENATHMHHHATTSTRTSANADGSSVTSTQTFTFTKERSPITVEYTKIVKSTPSSVTTAAKTAATTTTTDVMASTPTTTVAPVTTLTDGGQQATTPTARVSKVEDSSVLNGLIKQISATPSPMLSRRQSRQASVKYKPLSSTEVLASQPPVTQTPAPPAPAVPSLPLPGLNDSNASKFIKDSNTKLNSVQVQPSAHQIYNVLNEAINVNNPILLEPEFIEKVREQVRLSKLMQEHKQNRARRCCRIAEIMVFIVIVVMSLVFLRSVAINLSIIMGKEPPVIPTAREFIRENAAKFLGSSQSNSSTSSSIVSNSSKVFTNKTSYISQ